MTRTKMVCLLLFCVSILLIMVIVVKGSVKIEHFTATPVMTSCPPEFKMYMYEGVAYCCKGTVNRDATNIEKTCMPPVTAMEDAFCTLNDKQDNIPNCSSLTNNLLKRKGAAICPASKPNFCNSNRCCASSITRDNSSCTNLASGFCDSNPDIFRTLRGGQTTCQYQRIKETDTCPRGYTMSDMNPGGVLSGLTIYGCTTLTSTCYTSKLLIAMKAAGKDTTGLVSCEAAAAAASEISVNASPSCPTKFLISADGIPPTPATAIVKDRSDTFYLGQSGNLIVFVRIDPNGKVVGNGARTIPGTLSNYKLNTISDAEKMLTSLDTKNLKIVNGAFLTRV
jgi:hypothetical protein